VQLAGGLDAAEMRAIGDAKGVKHDYQAGRARGASAADYLRTAPRRARPSTHDRKSSQHDFDRGRSRAAEAVITELSA